MIRVLCQKPLIKGLQRSILIELIHLIQIGSGKGLYIMVEPFELPLLIGAAKESLELTGLLERESWRHFFEPAIADSMKGA